MTEAAAIFDEDDRIRIAAAGRAPTESLGLHGPERTLEERAGEIGLQRCESEFGRALVIDDELNRSVAEVADAVEENDRPVDLRSISSFGAHGVILARTGQAR